MKSRIKVKVCGMTRPQDVRAAVDLGVDAIGVILHADSPRLVSQQVAREIRAQVPAFVSLVGVFVDADKDTINQHIQNIGLDLIQLHGTETDAFGLTLGAPFIKAIRVRNSSQISRDIVSFPNARALLLDPYVPHLQGGTGEQLDPALWPRDATQKLVLAGGLSAINIAAAVEHTSPFAVDLNSGVELEPGVKDAGLISSTLQALGR